MSSLSLNEAQSREFELPEVENGWMPKPAMLHSGKSRHCAVCFAPLQYSSSTSWDEYLKSEEYLKDLQRNLLHDTYVRSLICGDNYFGDLPTEHRMNPQRRMKCRQNIENHLHRNNAGKLDDKSLIHILEELLMDGLPTSCFTYVLERRFAVMFHSAKIVATMMQSDRTQKLERARAEATPHVELHHVAIQALSVLLSSFDYTHEESIAPVLDMARLLKNFPPLSLFSYWSPEKKPPEEQILLCKDDIEVSTAASLHPASLMVDSNESTYWITPPRPGMVLLTLTIPKLPTHLSSIALTWHGLNQPQTLVLQCKVPGGSFSPVTEWHHKPGSPIPSLLTFPAIEQCVGVRLVMSGVPSANKEGTYGLCSIRLQRPKEDTTSPHLIMHDIENWLLQTCQLKPIQIDIVIEAFGVLQAWALATGALTACVRFLEMLLRLSQCSEINDHLANYLLQNAAIFYDALSVQHEKEIVRIAQTTPSNESRKVRAVFEATLCSSGTSVEDGGQSVRTRETSYQHALVNSPISTGKASWKFRLDNDTADDEMTCFGAAILPVTVSGYDSSPSLWMLRGYNGNLYARGHKLSRSIGKVHPGDIVQIDVDMSAGTMSYAINGTEFGVVFTDLAGHEVYPAVSFYGSGKVITLLSLHKWGDSTSMTPLASTAEPIYLSTLSEYEHFVGHGKFGRGNALGYTGESSTDGGQAPTTISIAGEHKQRSLSLHPPARGEAFVSYDLGQSYDTIEGSVGINDDVSSESLAQRGISLIYSIIGDTQVLWKSKPVTMLSSCESYKISIRNVRMLELRISCSGSNHGAHAIWVDPFVTAVEDWTCIHCDYGNKGTHLLCAVCKIGSRNKISPPSQKQITIEESKELSVQLCTTREELKRCKYDPVEEIATSILFKLHALAKTLVSTPNYQVQFEEAFCLQPNATTLEVLHSLLQVDLGLLSTVKDRRLELVSHRAWLWIEIIGFQLQNLERYNTRKDALPPKLLLSIKVTLESVASVHLTNPLSPSLKSKAWSPQPQHYALQMTAAQTLMSGISLLYPYPWDRTNLLLVLLRSHAQVTLLENSARYLMLTKLLETLASPGQMGILTLCPVLPDRTHVSNVQEILSNLLTCEGSLQSRAMECLKMFQLYILSQAIELTKSTQDTRESIYQARVVTQDAVLQYSNLLLNSCRHLLENQKTMGELEASIVGELLPWFVSGLCLLRRQVWLARPMLPKLVRLLRVLDVVAGQSDSVRKAEKRLLSLDLRLNTYSNGVDDIGKWQVENSPRRVQKQLYNVFSKLYTGEKDHFEGQIGFQFEAVASFTIVALGRSVNPSRNSGVLLHAHTIRLWDEASQALLASINVGPLSKRDAMGYVYEHLPSGIRLSQGKLYRLTTQEFANGGDPWYKKENLPDEEYDGSFIKILRDCYASGSSGFPNSQNLTGAAYGVPTFLVEEDNPMDTLPPIVPLDGVLSLKFSGKRKAASLTLGHLGNSMTVCGETEYWRTCFSTCTFVTGVHTIEFVIKSSRVGGGVSGHVCIGFEALSSNKRHPVVDYFLGQDSDVSSFGWMPAIGVFWMQGHRAPYGKRILLHHGDVCSMTLNFDEGTLSFAYNGQSLGRAPLDKFPASCLPAVSLYGVHDVVEIRTGGIAKSTLKLNWLLDVLETTASLTGRLAGTMISGPPVDGVEEELQPWLQSKLLSGGISNPSGKSGVQSWLQAVKHEWADCTDPQFALIDEKRLMRKDPLKKLSVMTNPEEDSWNEISFVQSLPTTAYLIVDWLEQMAPDSSIWKRQEKYPKAEQLMCAALIKHSPPHIVQEAKAVVAATDPNVLATIVPSPEMIQLWKSVLALRHWLIKVKHEYKAKDLDDEVPTNKATTNSDLEEKLTMPKSFALFVEQVVARAAFLASVEPPVGEFNQWGITSQVALSNLAEKWSSAQTPPSLQPMVDRWRSLSDSDSRKWSGLVQVLRALHKWRTETKPLKKSDTLDNDEAQNDNDDEAYLTAMIKACDLYVRHGLGAPPAVLLALFDRRYLRSKSRIFGFDAMRSTLGCLSFDSARYGALVFLRPALRGFTDDERVARESYTELGTDPSPAAFRPTVRHHYLKGLEGCVGKVLDEVQSSFMDLYALLASMLSKASTPLLQKSLICSWGLDFEPRDHEFLLRADIIAILSKHFSIGTLRDIAAKELNMNSQSNNEWYALSEQYVRQGILLKGTVAKRNVTTIVKQAP
ncbi:HECT E3 ubiquitin ligase, partial [Thraustotheca clavata]